ncbi:GNAT family N-acetyltransferase [Brevibacterium spongiae]|uniref:GNAT family N-acetyltransferase n=1 Tax=Brevibacterium spongiae TaxID=2909672 RepID=A0ABY5SQZ7_9MICO|nr:GNAT family N-acetyltransferase [Brevibacterium spongiae]UVI36953.1 GNAT family N-acetyltransferase [Brevibacterium spongiae]
MDIRPYDPADSEALGALFARAGEGSPTGTLWGDPESEADVYLTPYLRHDPASVLLAWERSGPVGYLAGCLDTAAFPREDKLIGDAISARRIMRRPSSAAFFARSAVDVVRDRLRHLPTAGELIDPRWPAHLHINVGPESRGTGAGAALMEAWIERLRDQSVPGCHLQTIVENRGAVNFFERSGFRRHGATPTVPGIRWQGGRVHQQTMVQEF